MAGLMNKRQIARNERTLQELLKQPGNDRCADCFTRNPGWASWNLGIFLCVRCGSLHRKLGTHISKVKSLSMDAWTQEQVENMKRIGNVASNRQFNPKQQKPNIPIDADEIDSAMERFIREKYQHKTLSGESRPLPSIRHNTGSSNSSNDTPPPLPPKNGPRINPAFRSQSSTYPSQAPLPSPPTSDWSSAGSRSGDIRRMGGIPEGTTVGVERNSFDLKLDRLKEMGFPNQSRNATILKGCGGDTDRAVETLTRLGEGYGNVLPKSRAAQTNGISFEPTPVAAAHASPQPTGTSGSQQPSRPPSSASNPFARQQSSQPNMPMPPTSTQPASSAMTGLTQSFQTVNISGQHYPSNALFPHSTGSSLAQQQPPAQNNPFLKTFTPPITPSPQQLSSGQVLSQPMESNPFLRSTRSQTLPQSNPFFSQATVEPNSHEFSQANPQGMNSSHVYSPQDFFSQAPQQQMQQHFQPAASQAYTVQSPSPMQPFPHQYPNGFNGLVQHQEGVQGVQGYQHANSHAQTYPAPQQQSMYAGQQQQQQQQMWPNPSSAQSMVPAPLYRDKSSIMALYASPSSQMQQPPGQPSLQQQPQQPQRSATMPISGSASNPFTAMAAGPIPPAGLGHVSRESMLFTGHGYQGRSPSPDAFSGLSARLG